MEMIYCVRCGVHHPAASIVYVRDSIGRRRATCKTGKRFERSQAERDAFGREVTRRNKEATRHQHLRRRLSDIPQAALL